MLDHMNERIDVATVARHLRPIMKAGLPVRLESAGDVLPRMRSALARATHPDDRLARVAALDGILHAILEQLGTEGREGATRVLFALPPAWRGRTLTDRRIESAGLTGYEYHHFRKHIEPQLLEAVAMQLHLDNLSYRPRVAGRPAKIEATGHTPALRDDGSSLQEEATSRVWALVYELRAELIRARRLADGHPDSYAFEDAADTALWVLARLLQQLAEFLDQYGQTIMHGEQEYAAERVIRLAGWNGGLSDDERDALRLAAVRYNDEHSFIAGLKSMDYEYRIRWRESLNE